MEMSIFVVPSHNRNITLEKQFVTLFYIFKKKKKNLLFEQLLILEPSMWQYILINYKEFQAPQDCSSPQPEFEVKNRYLYHLK